MIMMPPSRLQKLRGSLTCGSLQNDIPSRTTAVLQAMLCAALLMFGWWVLLGLLVFSQLFIREGRMLLSALGLVLLIIVAVGAGQYVVALFLTGLAVMVLEGIEGRGPLGREVHD